MIDYRADLIRLIRDGTQLAEILQYFTSLDFSYSEAHDFMRHCGVDFLMPRADHPHQDISPERKRELQDLSLT